MMLKTIIALFFLVVSDGFEADKAAGRNAGEIRSGQNASTPAEQQEGPDTAASERLAHYRIAHGPLVFPPSS